MYFNNTLVWYCLIFVCIIMRKKFTLSKTLKGMLVLSCLSIVGIFKTEGVLNSLSWFLTFAFGFITWCGFVCENATSSEKD